MQNNLKHLIGKRIHDFRVQNNYTQARFAECIDISVNFLSEIENGKKGMSQETLYKLCSDFGISANYILFGSEQCNTTAVPSMIIKAADIMSIDELNRTISYLTSLKAMREWETQNSNT